MQQYDGIKQDDDGMWRVKRLPRAYGRKRVGGRFDTAEKAARARETAMRIQGSGHIDYAIDEVARAHAAYNADPETQEWMNAPMGAYPDALRAATPIVPAVYGVTPQQHTDIDAIWRAAFAAQTATFAVAQQRRNQSIVLPNEPVAIAFLSDFHIGNGGTDYVSLKRDCETIRDTPGMYAVFAGDGVDNWLPGKLQGLQRYQAVNYDAEWALFEDVLTMLSSKLKVVVAGNHDNWTTKIGGIDRLRDLLHGVNTLYDAQQSVFALVHGDTTRRVCVRHKWRGNSVFNTTHAIETGWERNGVPFDWGIGGHVHIGSFCREFVRHGKRRSAILLGAYKLIDKFGEEIGFAPCSDTGCGAKVLHPNGGEYWFASLREAAEFVTYLRSR